MISLKSVRIRSLLGIATLLTACGTNFKSISLNNSSDTGVVPKYGPPRTPPPLPQPLPGLGDMPGPSSTGVPLGFTLKSSGGMTVNVDGVVLDGLDIKGPVHIHANNVTLKRSKITVANYVQVSIDEGVTGVIVEDCEISGVGSSNDGAMGIQGPGTFLRNNIHHVQSGIVPNSGALIQDNYVHDLMASGTPSYNGIQIEGGVENVQIYHNAIVNANPQNSAVLINNFFGSVNNIVIRNNLLVGGAYTVVTEGQYSGGLVSQIVFDANQMVQGTKGFKLFTSVAPLFTQNTDGVTGKPLP